MVPTDSLLSSARQDDFSSLGWHLAVVNDVRYEGFQSVQTFAKVIYNISDIDFFTSWEHYEL